MCTYQLSVSVAATGTEEGIFRPGCFCAVSGNRADSHALYTVLDPMDPQMYVPIRRGDITVHNETVCSALKTCKLLESSSQPVAASKADGD